VIAACTGYFLSRPGLDVIVVERTDVAAAASGKRSRKNVWMSLHFFIRDMAKIPQQPAKKTSCSALDGGCPLPVYGWWTPPRGPVKQFGRPRKPY
jgi:hypothetical protein